MTELDDNQLLDKKPFSQEYSSSPNVEPEKATSPILVLAMGMGFFVVGNLIGGLIMTGLSLQIEGQAFDEVLKNIGENSPAHTRNFMRGIMLLNHLFSFIIPALLTVWLVYKKNLSRYFRLTTPASMNAIIWGFILLIVSSPFVQWAYQINKSLPLPKWMVEMENSTGKILETIITKESPYEVLINLFLIAILPAIGEELMFRGLIQQQLGRLFKNDHVTVWVSAAFFSAIHMQFEGFLARMILGALLGYLLIWTRNLWVPMIVHFFNNGLQVMALYAMNIKPSEMNAIEQGDKIHWTMGIASLMLMLIVSKYIRENIEAV